MPKEIVNDALWTLAGLAGSVDVPEAAERIISQNIIKTVIDYYKNFTLFPTSFAETVLYLFSFIASKISNNDDKLIVMGITISFMTQDRLKADFLKILSSLTKNSSRDIIELLVNNPKAIDDVVR